MFLVRALPGVRRGRPGLKEALVLGQDGGRPQGVMVGFPQKISRLVEGRLGLLWWVSELLVVATELGTPGSVYFLLTRVLGAVGGAS